MAKKKRTSRRRRSIRGLNSGDISSLATSTVLPGIVGAVAANYLDRLPFLKDNPQYANYGGIALGLILATAVKNPMARAAGVGLAVVAGGRVAADLLDGQSDTNGMGRLLPVGTPSAYITGVPDGSGVINQ